MAKKNTVCYLIPVKNILTPLIAILFIFISTSAGCVGTDQDGPSSLQSDQKILTISGSTTIQPVSEILAATYMNEHPGVDIIVNGGGSSTGIEEAGSGLVDIGAASREVKDSELSEYPDLEVYKIGASAIVIITSQNNDLETISFEELCALYDDSSEDISRTEGIADIEAVIQRSEESGTEETFAGWLFSGEKNVDSSLNTADTGNKGIVRQLSAEGNAEVLNLVKDNPFSIGFVDFGYAEYDPGVKILKIVDKDSDEALPYDINDIREAILLEIQNKDRGDDGEAYYIAGLTRPLNYIIKEGASPLAEGFISFATSSSSRDYFNEIGYFSVTELNGEI